MKITELLISIVIFVLVFTCFLQSYTLFQKNNMAVLNRVNSSIEILKIDYMLRGEINKIKIPYWENDMRFVENEKNRIFMLNIEGVSILSVEIYNSSQGAFKGFNIRWCYNDEIFETKETFCSKGIIK